MSEDRYTEVTSESWFSRIGSSIKGIICGILFFVAAFPLLFWNEGRAVKRYKTLNEGAGAVVSIEAESINPANEGKLVHIVAEADTDVTLSDPLFGIEVTALKLKRVVEMYQWQESSQSEQKKKLGGGTETITTYTYSKLWADSLIRSSGFKKLSGHQNPSSMPYHSTQKISDRISLGAFTLSPTLSAEINNFSPLVIDDETSIPPSIKEKAVLYDGGLYFGRDPMSPQIGDVRVYFRVALPTTVSLIGRQTGKTFAPYKTKAGGTIELLQLGTYKAEDMIQKAQQSNMILTWVLRIAGFVLMVLGLVTVLRPLAVLADIVPMIGSIVGAGTGIISILVASVLSLITIAIAWLVYRPIWGIILVVIALGVTWVIRSKLKSGRLHKTPPPLPNE